MNSQCEQKQKQIIKAKISENMYFFNVKAPNNNILNENNKSYR